MQDSGDGPTNSEVEEGSQSDHRSSEESYESESNNKEPHEGLTSDPNPEPTEDASEETTDEPPHKKRKTIFDSAEEFQKKIRRTGLVFITSLPPGMKAKHIRSYLQEFGNVKRIYCELEPEEKWQARKRRKGNKKRQFDKAWVEFEQKKDAKKAAAILNATQMGGSKRSPFYYFTWSMKYLKKFKWNDLTEELRHKKMEREKKLRAQLANAKKEANAYLQAHEKSMARKKIEARRKAVQVDPSKIDTKDKSEESEPVILPPREILLPQKPREEVVLDDDFLKGLMTNDKERKQQVKPKHKSKKRKRINS